MTDPLDVGFRKAMRTLTSAVTIISTESGSRRFGMTATAVTSLSMAPAFAACVRQHVRQHPRAAFGKRRVLRECSPCEPDRSGRSIQFEKDRRPLFRRRVAEGRPCAYLVGAQANVSCEIEASYVHGTYRIFIGRVLRMRVREQVNPLIYQDGRYTVGLGDGVDWVVPTA